MSLLIRTLLFKALKSEHSCLLRSCSTYKIVGAKKLLYEEYGEPIEVLKAKDDEIQFNEKSNQVLLKMIAAPVNPADINTIQGKYAVKPKLPSVPGNEGVGEVIAAGDTVKHFKAGDRVVPLTAALGTWRTHLVVQCSDLYKVPKDIGIAEAATLTVNPCTAYRMLKDFVELKKGDVVLQNGANSAVGQNVIQICRAWGLVSVNVIRDREDAIHLKKYLESLGADHVLTESELRKTKLFKEKKIAKPKLALNCVGGPIGTEITRHIEKAGTLVTYGAMSRQPLALSAATLIFNDLRFRGFWMTAWNKEHAQDPKRQEMLSDVINMILKGDIRPATHAMIPFSDYKQALANTMTAQGMAGKKYILDFHETKNKI